MSDNLDTRQYLGPLVNQLYIADLCDFNERVWEAYRTHARDCGAIDPGSYSPDDVVRDVAPETVERFRQSGYKLPLWTTEPLNKGDRQYFEGWNELDLKSMADKRDSFPPIAYNRLSMEKLGDWYNSVYRQFSSVSHYDRYSIEFIKPLPIESGNVVLGLEPHWPKLLILYTALLDIIQCYEVTAVCFERDTSIKFESLFSEWKTFAERFEFPMRNAGR